jgi:hypothetical protein
VDPDAGLHKVWIKPFKAAKASVTEANLAAVHMEKPTSGTPFHETGLQAAHLETADLRGKVNLRGHVLHWQRRLESRTA